MRNYYLAQGTLLNALCDVNGKEIQKREDIRIHRADSPCCMVET